MPYLQYSHWARDSARRHAVFDSAAVVASKRTLLAQSFIVRGVEDSATREVGGGRAQLFRQCQALPNATCEHHW